MDSMMNDNVGGSEMNNADSAGFDSSNFANQGESAGSESAGEGTPQDGSADDAKGEGPRRKKRSRRGGRRRRGKRGAEDAGTDATGESAEEAGDGASDMANGVASDEAIDEASEEASESAELVSEDASSEPRAKKDGAGTSKPKQRDSAQSSNAQPREAKDEKRGPRGRRGRSGTERAQSDAPRVQPITNDDDEWGEAPIAKSATSPLARGIAASDSARATDSDVRPQGEAEATAPTSPGGDAADDDDAQDTSEGGRRRRNRRGGRGRRGRGRDGDRVETDRVSSDRPAVDRVANDATVDRNVAERDRPDRKQAAREERGPRSERAGRAEAPLAKRNAGGTSKMLINYVPGEECRVAIIENGKLEELHVERASAVGNVGNIYVGKVMNVEPAIQAAFIDYGMGENGFLHVTDLHPRYFPGEERNTERVGIKTPRRDRPPIQAALRRGDEIIVQVLKEGVGTKGPSLTGYLSIPGRFLVMMPYMDKVGVSRKVEDEDQRRQMREILDQLELPEGFGFILRTAGMERTKAELKRDLAYLQRLWKDMDRRLKAGGKPRLLYSESDLLVRALRDLLTNDIDEIIIDNEQALHRAARFLKIVAPRNAPKLFHYTDPTPMFHMFDVESQISLMHAREVPLPSGGRLVIDQTEALVAIDVNSGKSRDSRDSETNAFQTNLEAVDEICRQLRLRDMGGIVINDLIDMRDPKHRREIENRMTERLRRDRAKSTVLSISEFGILQLTRQRMRPSHESVHFSECPHCRGRGLLQKPDSVCGDALRDLSALLNVDNVKRVELVVSGKIAGELLSGKRQMLGRVERTAGKRVDVRVSEAVAADRVMFYAYDGNGSDIDLSNLQRPKRNATLTEWVDPDVSPTALVDGESDDEASLPPLLEADDGFTHEAIIDDEDDDDQDGPARSDASVHPIELDLPSDVEPSRDGWGAPPMPARAGRGRRGARALRTTDAPATVRAGRAAPAEMRDDRSRERRDERGGRPESRDGGRDGRDGRGGRPGPDRVGPGRTQTPRFNDDDEWGEPPTRAPQMDLAPMADNRRQRSDEPREQVNRQSGSSQPSVTRQPSLTSQATDRAHEPRSGGRDGGRDRERGGRGRFGDRDARRDGPALEPRRFNDDDEWGEPPLPLSQQSGLSRGDEPRQANADGDQPTQSPLVSQEASPRDASDDDGQDRATSEGDDGRKKRRRRRRRGGRGGEGEAGVEGGVDGVVQLPEATGEIARPSAVRAQPVQAPMPSERSRDDRGRERPRNDRRSGAFGGSGFDESRFDGNRDRLQPMRDDSDEWGEPPLSEQDAAQQRDVARKQREDTRQQSEQAARDKTPLTPQVAQAAAHGEGVDDESSEPNEASLEPVQAKRGRRGRRGRGGAKDAATNAEASAKVPINAQQDSVEPAQPKVAEAKSEPAVPSAAISPLARGVAAVPSPAGDAVKPRTLYAGRRGKAAPKGRSRSDDR